MSTTTGKTSEPKAAKAAKPAKAPSAPVKAKTAPVPANTSTPKVVEAPQPVIVGPVMRKKELMNAVVERSGVKKKDAKPVIEAMLAVLGEALADNRELNLQPFGRIKVRKERTLGNGRLMITKIRQVDATGEAKDTASEA